MTYVGVADLPLSFDQLTLTYVSGEGVTLRFDHLVIYIVDSPTCRICFPRFFQGLVEYTIQDICIIDSSSPTIS